MTAYTLRERRLILKAPKESPLNLQQYRENRRQQAQEKSGGRERCWQCRQPGFGCFCAQVQPVHCPITFVILIHPVETRRRIATGRMAHLSLPGSHLIEGCDYSQNASVNALLDDPSNHCVMLYPGQRSINLTHATAAEQQALLPLDKNLVVFVIDGTWATARKMVRLSENLHTLPRVCFSPPRPSNFRVRKQPAPECFSTIEAIHHTIELTGDARGFNTALKEQDRLLHVFDWMVERQLEFVEKSRTQGPSRYRRERERKSS